MNYIIKLFFLSIIIFIGSEAFCTHNRAGEIIYDQIGPNTIRATIITYTKASSAAADRDTLTINWGDGSFQNVGRSNGNGEEIPGRDIKINYYEAEHTYPGKSTYTISFMDPNRVSDVVNLNFPNSVDIPFYVQTTFTLLNSQFQGLNSSARLLQPPIDFACIFQRFEHNPNAYDPDGDSLAYELIVPFEDVNKPVPNYLFPDAIIPGFDNVISLDERTGDFVWNAPKSAGEYSIALLIKEYRDGLLINQTVRDMQIFVDLCDNEPPIIESIKEICVVAGDKIEFPISVDDPNEGQLVELSYTGGPFELEISPPVIDIPTGFQDVKFEGTLTWQTVCEHANDQNYQIVLKAQDNFSFNGQFGLVDLQTIVIKVVAPPPENLEAQKENNAIDLIWDKPYNCEETIDSFFLGFSVWRRLGSNPFEIDSCAPGLDGKGYQKIEFQTKEFENGKYIFSDTDLPAKGIVCYRTLAQFAPRTSSGFAYNIVESIASNEVCIHLSGDLPLITNVDVDETSSTDGEIFVKWSKPNTQILDTLENKGPYTYQLLRSDDGGANYISLDQAVYNVMNIEDIAFFEFTDVGLNTRDIAYTYKVDFYIEGETLYGSSETASSIFLDVVGTDKKNNLSWNELVPWQNYEYIIYRLNDQSGQYDSIWLTNENLFEDSNLENGIEYCYYIQANGTYGLPGFVSPLINRSQIKCSIPVDSIAPCQLTLEVSNPCSDNPTEVVGDFVNRLQWIDPATECSFSRDVASYNIYFKATIDEELALIYTIEDPKLLNYDHLPDVGISGCYAVSAIDSLGNESILSEVICVENCPVYKLPNTFTPNGDGANEFFVPIENRFVENVIFKVFNRWGNLMFETQDPELNWNGDAKNGSTVDDGVYYYTCEIFERTVSGNIEQKDILSGYIQVITD